MVKRIAKLKPKLSPTLPPRIFSGNATGYSCLHTQKKEKKKIMMKTIGMAFWKSCMGGHSSYFNWQFKFNLVPQSCGTRTIIYFDYYIDGFKSIISS